MSEHKKLGESVTTLDELKSTEGYIAKRAYLLVKMATKSLIDRHTLSAPPRENNKNEIFALNNCI